MRKLLFFIVLLLLFSIGKGNSKLLEETDIIAEDSFYISTTDVFLYDTLSFNLFSKTPYDVYSTGYSIKQQYIDSTNAQNDWFYFNNASNNRVDYIRILYNCIPELYHYRNYDLGCIIVNKGTVGTDTLIVFAKDTIYSFIVPDSIATDTICIANMSVLELSTSSIRIAFKLYARKKDSLQIKFLFGKYKR